MRDLLNSWPYVLSNIISMRFWGVSRKQSLIYSNSRVSRIMSLKRLLLWRLLGSFQKTGSSYFSLFHLEIAACVKKSFLQDHGLCYIHLPLFSNTYTLLFHCKIKTCWDRCFPLQIRPQTTIETYQSYILYILPECSSNI